MSLAKATGLMTHGDDDSCQFCLWCEICGFYERRRRRGEKRFLQLLSFTSVHRRRNRTRRLQLPTVPNGSILFLLAFSSVARIVPCLCSPRHTSIHQILKISSVCRLCEHLLVWGIYIHPSILASLFSPLFLHLFFSSSSSILPRACACRAAGGMAPGAVGSMKTAPSSFSYTHPHTYIYRIEGNIYI
jgi:hypothetical protein